MPHIHPITELKTHFNHLADICNKENEPVYLTRKGHGELVLLSLAGYEQLLAKVKQFEESEAIDFLWVKEAEARYAEIEAGGVICRPLDEAVQDTRGKLK